MKLISHRGNTDGAQPELENSWDYIWNALNDGFDVEVDVWYVDKSIWLGHDKPQYHIGHPDFMLLLYNHRVWWHAKDYKTLNYMLSHGRQIKVFAHESDRYGLVNGGYIWTADTSIRLEPDNRTVWILPNNSLTMDDLDPLLYGICTDDFTGILKGSSV